MSSDDQQRAARTPDAEGSAGEPVQRLSARHRKRRLMDAGPLFQQEETPAPQADDPDPETGLPGHLADLAAGVIEPVPLDVPPGIPPRPSTPPAERYPPLPDQIAHQATDAPDARPVVDADAAPTLRRRRMGDWRHDLIALGFFLGTLALIAYFVTLWNDPYSPLNPLAPATPFTYVTWTPDPAAAALYEATQAADQRTATAEAQIRASSTPAATLTPVLPATMPAAAVIIPTLPADALRYLPMEPAYAPDPGGSCTRPTLAGVVTGPGGVPVDGLRVRIIDLADPQRLDVELFSGSATERGSGAYALALGRGAGGRAYVVQVFDVDGTPRSDPVQVAAGTDCDTMVLLLNFRAAGDVAAP